MKLERSTNPSCISFPVILDWGLEDLRLKRKKEGLTKEESSDWDKRKKQSKEKEDNPSTKTYLTFSL